ncbi:MAG: sulfatase-like hydrolase/transferase [Candidatus Rifleibacteriota bacterium]
MILNILLILDFQVSSSGSSLQNPDGKVLSDIHGKENLPDIYYILVDGYGNDQILKKLYAFDNHEFIGFLKEKGFFIAQDSFANYMQTALSLSSSLNICFLDFLAEKYKDQNTAEPVMELIGKSRVVETLRAKGYKIVAFASGYATTEIDSADLYFGKTLINREFYHILLNTTILSGIKFELFDFTATQVQAHGQLINSIVDGLADLELGKNSKPAFVFAHLTIPHPPFIFDKEGKLKFQQPRGFHFGDGNHWGDPMEYRKQYVEQLQHLNELLKKALSGILKNGRQKIVILQSDHGPGSMLNWEDSKNTFLPERFSILNAYYFSDQDYSGLYKNISPVNSFRLVFNKLFKAGFELEEDKNFFSPWTFRYRFENVTELLKTQRQKLVE